ncbi:hypothetical protein [Gimesia chilikensis]|nr:hypothetical protein [Gimesia chilikensis]
MINPDDLNPHQSRKKLSEQGILQGNIAEITITEKLVPPGMNSF